MIIKQSYIMLIFAIICCACNSYAQNIDSNAVNGYNYIQSHNILSHIKILASDSLEGRETGFAGQKKAANYIASQLKNLRIEPINLDSSYFQYFDINISTVKPTTHLSIKHNGKEKSNYYWHTDFISQSCIDTVVSGNLVFVGFVDTEIDSLIKPKLKDRIIISFIGKKNYSNDSSRYATFRRLSAIRRDNGALATLLIPDEDGQASFYQAKEFIEKIIGGNGFVQMKTQAHTNNKKNLNFIVSRELAKNALNATGKSLNQLYNEAISDNFSPTFIDSTFITIDTDVADETRSVENIGAIIKGSDSLCNNMFTVLTVHYDHIGINKKGEINYGADDNASGTAALLEIANAFKVNFIKPKSSIMFLFFAGEEKGLFGSYYYVNNPIVPLANNIAVINMDMIGRLDSIHEANCDTNYTYLVGSDKVSKELDSILVCANAESVNIKLDYKYNADNSPEMYYYRSDHYNFAKNGIPAVFLFNGLHKDYHKPADTPDKIIRRKTELIAKLVYNLTWKLSNIQRHLGKP